MSATLIRQVGESLWLAVTCQPARRPRGIRQASTAEPLRVV